MPTTLLVSRMLLRISGEEAAPFLQGLITNDVLRLQEGEAAYAALLSPQGKYLHDFFLIRRTDGFVLDCGKARVTDLLQRLKQYRLRSKVQIDLLDGWAVAALWNHTPERLSDAPAADALMPYADPRMPQLGWRIAGEEEAIVQWLDVQGLSENDESGYERLRIGLGVPDSGDLIVDKSILLEFGMDALHAIDFAKGCYVGQEVTARSKYRGQIRKCLHQVASESGAALPEPGTPVYAGENPAGELRSSIGGQGLALLRLEAVAAAGGRLSAGGMTITAWRPSWFPAPAQV